MGERNLYTILAGLFVLTVGCSASAIYEKQTGNKIGSPKEQVQYAIWAAENGFCGDAVLAFNKAIKGFSPEGLEQQDIGLQDFYELNVAYAKCNLMDAERVYLTRNQSTVLDETDRSEASHYCKIAWHHIANAITMIDYIEEEEKQKKPKEWASLTELMDATDFYCGPSGIIERSRDEGTRRELQRTFYF